MVSKKFPETMFNCWKIKLYEMKSYRAAAHVYFEEHNKCQKYQGARNFTLATNWKIHVIEPTIGQIELDSC